MALLLTIENPADLNAVIDLVHDRWFNKDDIIFDSGSASLVIRFGSEAPGKLSTTDRGWFSKERKRFLVEWILKIRNVQRYSIVDRAGIGRYDFNQVIYDESARTVTINSGFPFQIVIAVKDLAITVEETAEVLRKNNGASSI